MVIKSVVNFTLLTNVFLGGDTHIYQKLLDPVPVITMQLKVVSFFIFLLIFCGFLLFNRATAF